MNTRWEENLNLSKFKTSDIRIDVGADVHAPTAAQWLYEDDECFIIIVEPVAESYRNLWEGKGGLRNLNNGDNFYLRHKDGSIMRRGEVVKTYDPSRVVLINGAIANISHEPQYRTLYTFGNGTSSLLRPMPTIILNQSITSPSISVYSLEYVLDQLGLTNESRITHIKTDTQGTDFDVIKSLGKYLPQVGTIKCEWHTWDQYNYEFPNQQNAEMFTTFMQDNGFEYVGADAADVLYHNVKKFLPNLQELREYQLKLRQEQFNHFLKYFNFAAAE